MNVAGQPIPDRLIKLAAAMPADWMEQVFAFSSKFPQAVELTSTHFDLTIAMQIILQKDLPYAQKYKEWKKTFYEAYNQEDVMSRDAPTTDPEVDRARTVSLITHLVKEKKLPKMLRMFVGGIGTGQRFEGPLVEDLAREGIAIDWMLAVDRLDFRKDYPPTLKALMKEKKFTFVKADFADPKFDPKERFDVVILPWSALSDVIAKQDIVGAMQRFQQLLTPGGVLIIDIPFPIDTGIYVPMIADQMQQFGVQGVLEKAFRHGNRDLLTLLNIMHIREIMLHAYSHGLLPDPENFPVAFDEQKKLCDALNTDDSVLTRQHESGEDRNAVASAAWMARPGWPRATLALRNVGSDVVDARLGMSGSWLVEWLFGSIPER